MLHLVGVLAFLMPCAVVASGVMGSMMLVKLLRFGKFMALAGNPEQGNGQQKDRE
jgi:hypothetical protein